VSFWGFPFPVLAGFGLDVPDSRGIALFVLWMWHEEISDSFSPPPKQRKPKQPKMKFWHGDLFTTLDHWIMGEEFFSGLADRTVDSANKAGAEYIFRRSEGGGGAEWNGMACIFGHAAIVTATRLNWKLWNQLPSSLAFAMNAIRLN
jgi:hypothetical protein